MPASSRQIHIHQEKNYCVSTQTTACASHDTRGLVKRKSTTHSARLRVPTKYKIQWLTFLKMYSESLLFGMLTKEISLKMKGKLSSKMVH